MMNTTEFHVIDGTHPHFKKVEKIFVSGIGTVYGDQSNAIEKLSASRDRVCEGMYNKGHLAGIIQYKKALAGVDLDLKTLVLRNPGKDKGKGFGRQLVRRAAVVASLRGAKGVVVSVSSEVSAAVLPFFKRFGFAVVETVEDKYKKGFSEHFMRGALARIEDSLQQRKSRVGASSSSSRVEKASSASASHRPEVGGGEKKRMRPVSVGEGDRRAMAHAGGGGGAAPARHRTESYGTVVPGMGRGRGSALGGVTSSGGGRGGLITCTLQRKYVELIRSGHKTWEGRCSTTFFKDYQPGRLVKFFAGRAASVTVRIVERKTFRGFREMLTAIGHQYFVPGVPTLEDAVRLYHNIPRYQEKAQRFGALAFKVEVVPDHQQPSGAARSHGGGR